MKPFEGLGYDLEEHYFHRINRELAERQRNAEKSTTSGGAKILEFKPRPATQTQEKKRKAA